MKTFSFSDLSRRSGDVLDAAMVEPVSLVKRGKTKLVMMPIERYESLVGRANTQRSHTIYNAPDNVREALLEGLDDILRDDD